MKKKFYVGLIALLFIFFVSCNSEKAANQDIDKTATPPDSLVIDDPEKEGYPAGPVYGAYYKEFEYEIERIEYSELIINENSSETVYLNVNEFESLKSNNQIDDTDLFKLSYMQSSNLSYNDYFNYKVGDKVIDATFDKFGGNRDLVFDNYKKTHERNAGNYNTANSWEDLIRKYTYEPTDCRSMYSSDYDRDLLYASKLYVYDSYNLKIDGKMRIINILIELKYIGEK